MHDVEAAEWIQNDAIEMAELLRTADPGAAVPACPEWTAADLSSHIAGGFAGWYEYNAATPASEWSVEGLMGAFAMTGASVDDHLGNVGIFLSAVNRFLETVTGPERDRVTWCFGGEEAAGWWLRRAGTELTVHLTDAAGVHGRVASTAPAGHCEAIDELAGEVYPRFAAIVKTMGVLRGIEVADVPTPPSSPAAFVATDSAREWTLRIDSDGNATRESGIAGDAVAVAEASSADLLAWFHGRPMSASLAIEGLREVLDGWNLGQRAAGLAS